MGPERRLVNIIGVHPHLVIPGAQIQLGEEARAVEFVKEFIDHGDGKRVLDSEGVEGAVVDAKSPRAISLLDEKGESLRRMTPCAIMAAHWRFSSSLWAAGYRYGRTATRAEPGLRTMEGSRVR